MIWKNSVVTKNKEHTYFSFINEGVIITNINWMWKIYCTGSLNISKGKISSDILCENISGEYFFYTKYANANMDP